MLAQPYKINKDSPIDFLLAGVRGTLAGIAGGTAAKDQARQLAFENQFKLDTLQEQKDALQQSWDISQSEIQSRKDEIIQSSNLDLAKAKIVNAYDMQLADHQMANRLIGDIFNNGMQLEVEKQKSINDNYWKGITAGNETARIGIEQKNANTAAKNADTNANRVAQYIENAGANLDVKNQRVTNAQERLDLERQNDTIGRGLQLLKATKAEAAAKAVPTVYNTLLRLQSTAAKTVATDDNPANIQQYNSINLASAKYAADNFTQDNTVSLKIKVAIGYNDINLLYSQYLAMLKDPEHTLPNGDTLSAKQVAPILSADMPPGTDIEINKDLNKDKDQQDYNARIKQLSDAIDKMGNPLSSIIPQKVPVDTGTVNPVPTTGAVNPVPAYTGTKEKVVPSIIPTKTPNWLKDINNWDSFIDYINIINNRDPSRAFDMVGQNKLQIYRKFGSTPEIKKMLDQWTGSNLQVLGKQVITQAPVKYTPNDAFNHLKTIMGIPGIRGETGVGYPSPEDLNLAINKYGYENVLSAMTHVYELYNKNSPYERNSRKDAEKLIGEQLGQLKQTGGK